jgi:hypothetical protein
VKWAQRCPADEADVIDAWNQARLPVVRSKLLKDL